MKTISQIESELKLGAYDLFLKKLYGEETQTLSKAQNRVSTVLSRFCSTFDEGRPAALFSGPGRTEIGGNHTDHQHGHVLCGSADMDMLACAAPNGLSLIRIQSEGYPALEVNLDDLKVKSGEDRPRLLRKAAGFRTAVSPLFCRQQRGPAHRRRLHSGP